MENIKNAARTHNHCFAVLSTSEVLQMGDTAAKKTPTKPTNLKQGGKGWRAFAWLPWWPWNSYWRRPCVLYQTIVNVIWEMEWYQRIFCCYTNQYKSVFWRGWMARNRFIWENIVLVTWRNLSLILYVINKIWRTGKAIPTKNTLQIVLWIDLECSRGFDVANCKK